MPFVALGLGRFAYGLLVQPMRSDLGWSYTEAGLLTTSNSVGHLLGAFAASNVIRQIGAERCVVWGTWAMAALLLLNGLTGEFSVVLAIRLATGVCAALAFIAGGVLAARLSASDVRWALVAYPTGAAGAIAVTAIGIPGLVTIDSRWPFGWFLLAGMATICALVLGAMFRGTTPVGLSSSAKKRENAHLPRPELAYGLFGLGYIGYVTFAVAYLEDGGATPSTVTAFWLVLGVASIAATTLWQRFDSIADDRFLLVATIGGCALGVIVLIVSNSTPFALISGLVFGASFLAVVSAVTSLARDRLPEVAWTAAIGRLTVMFGIGQIFGPVLAGLLGDSSAGLRAGLGFSALVLGAGTLVALSARAKPVA